MSKASLRLKPEDYARIDEVVNLKGDEYYSVVTTPHRGRYVRSIHVFHRQPTTKELLAFESLSTKIRIRGNRTDFDGSPLEAFVRLYNTLVSRVYDVPVGNRVMGQVRDEKGQPIKDGRPLDVAEASKYVPDMLKRRALADILGNHITESQASEMAEDEEGPADVTDALAPLTGGSVASISGETTPRPRAVTVADLRGAVGFTENDM
jgi:hypothetical protein